MRNRIGILPMLAAVVVLAGCVTTNKDLDKKVASEPQVQNRAALSVEATSLIQNSKNLNSDQKTNLIALRDSTRQQLDDLQKESMKLRSVLIHEVLSSNYNPKE